MKSPPCFQQRIRQTPAVGSCMRSSAALHWTPLAPGRSSRSCIAALPVFQWDVRAAPQPQLLHTEKRDCQCRRFCPNPCNLCRASPSCCSLLTVASRGSSAGPVQPGELWLPRVLPCACGSVTLLCLLKGTRVLFARLPQHRAPHKMPKRKQLNIPVYIGCLWSSS